MEHNNSVESRLERIEELLLNQKAVFNIHEVSRYTGFSVDYIYKLTHRQQIPFSKPLGKVLFFEKEKIDEWLVSNPSITQDEMQTIAANHLVKSK